MRSESLLARALALVAFALLAAGSTAQAAVLVGVSVQFPETVRPGQVLTATLVLSNDNTAPNDNVLNGNTVTEVRLTPSCGEVAGTATCPAASVDTGVFTLSSPATGDDGCIAGGGDFLISAPDANGQVLITPDFAGSFEINKGAPCIIQFQFTVNAKATKDADGDLSGVQTAALVDLTATDTQAFDGGGFGSTTISFPVLTPTPSAGGTLAPSGNPPVHLTNTAVLTGLVPTSATGPEGTVTFSLFRSDDPSCLATPFQTQAVDLADCTIDQNSPNEFRATCSTSATFTANRAGTWHWRVGYSGDADNVPLTVDCSVATAVVVNKASPILVSTPDPAIGVVLQTPLRDTVTLTGFTENGVLTGTLNISLKPPAGCAAPSIVADSIVVGNNGTFHSSVAPASAITVAGKYFWRVVYTGDANNNEESVSEECLASDEGVLILDPTTLSITKTPDGAVITPGDTATFNITATNTGTAGAVNITVTDPLPAGALLTWTTPTPGCTITGSGAAQTLSCFAATRAPGDSFVASVSALTTAGSCTVMASSATAQAINAAAVSNGGSITCQQPALSVSKTPDNASITSGQTATFSVTATNNGPGIASNVVISDPLPAGALLAWQTSSAGCSITGSGASQALACTAGNLAQGASFTATVSAVTSAGKCPVLNNTATAKGTNTNAASDAGSITCQQPVLAVTKTPDAGVITAGATATFTISVTNNGPGTASGVVIDDSLPSGALLAWNTTTPGCTITGSGASQALACTVGTLGAGASFAASVSAATGVGKCPAAINNIATAKGSNTAQASDGGSIACQQPVLSVSKTPNGGFVTSGEAATFAITVTNNGSGAATSVTLSDPLPQTALLTWTTSSPGCTVVSGTAGAQTLSCQAGNLAAGASFTAGVSAVTGVGSCPATIANTAFAAGNNAAEASDSGSIGCQQPVLSLAKTPDSGIVISGEIATFTLAVTNQGPGTAGNVVISDPLPQGAVLAWETTTAGCAITGSGAAQALSCAAGNLAAGASFVATVSAVTGVGKCPATIANAATAQGSNTANVSDSGSIACQQPVLAMVKTPDGTVITAGDTAAFTITVTNNGPGTASNVVVSDPLPQGTLLAWQTTTSGCAITGSGTGQTLSCTVASLAANASFVASVSAVTGPGRCPAMDNTATATGSNTAAASDSGSIACEQPVLLVSKTPDGATVIAGDTATFTITVTNNGPGTAHNVAVSDALPEGALLAWQTSSAGCAITGAGEAQSLACTLTSLAAGASFTAAVSAVTAVDKCPTLGNSASARGSNTVTASDAASITCRTPPILTKSTTPGTIGVGGTATITYTLTNVAGNPGETVSFIDRLVSTLRVAASASIGGTCPNAAAATAATPGGSTVSSLGLEVPPGPSSCTVTVVVTSAPGQTGTCPAPGPSGIVSSSNILVDESTDACVVVKTYPSELGVTTLATLTLGDGTGGIATDPLLRRAYVTNAAPPGVSVIDLDALTVVATIPLQGHPEKLVSNAATGTLYVLSDTAPGALIVVDALAYVVVATIPVGDHPQGIAADFPRGEVYVTNRGGDSLSVVDTSRNAVVATIPAIGREPGEPGLDAGLGRLYVPSALDAVVAIIDLDTRTVRARVAVGRNPGGAAVSEALHKVYVNNVGDRTVSVIDGATDTVAATISPIGAGSMPALVNDVYRRAYVPNAGDGTLSIIDTVTDAVVKALAVGASPQQAAIDPDRGDVYVVNRQSSTVSVIDALTNGIVVNFDVGADPWSVAVASDRLLVLNENGAAADTLTIAFDGGTQQDTVIATEFYSRDIDHYDHSANSLEARLVNDGIVGDVWAPTGEHFRVWSVPGAGRSPMCAFSTAGYGAKDSSYYTPYAQECTDLRNSAAWYYEGTGYYVAVPDASGACPSSTAELYLLYNNRQGGAPNWRYTGSRATRDEMVVNGWSARGTGAQHVFACTPPLAGTPSAAGRRVRHPSMLVKTRPRFAAEDPIRKHRVGEQDR